MKGFLAVISVLVSVAVAEPPAPYPPSGWRPSGPTFDLPQRGQQPQEYLPPVDPRNAARPTQEYGTPEVDVSVQGLPVPEEVQYFQASPINGQQNVGPAFKSDIRNLNKGLQQTQYQQQQQTYRQFDRQSQIDSRLNGNNLPRLQPPGPFARTTPAPTEPTTPVSTTEATTELNLNEEETVAPKKSEKVTVEVTKQRVQEYPGELFLSSLAQLQLQPQFVPLQQFGQIRQDSQKQVAGYDAQTHFAALPSILAQQQLQKQNLQSPALLIAEQPQQPISQLPVTQLQPVAQLQPVNSYQQPTAQLPANTYQPQQPALQIQPVTYQPEIQAQPVNAYQPQFQAEPVPVQPQTLYAQPEQPLPQYQPINYQPQLQAVPQFPAQPVVLQPQGFNQVQPQQPKPDNPDAESIEPYQPQNQQPFLVQPGQFQGQFQPQPAQFQPQPAQFQPQPAQFQPQPAQFQPQPAQFQPQLTQFQLQPAQFQGQFQPQPALIQAQPVNYPQPQYQSPDALQSGLDANQQGNDIEEDGQEIEEKDYDNTATAVATAFGARTQPRVFTQYGAPYPVPKVQASPELTTTEPPAEDVTEDEPVVAQAVAVAQGSRKKSAKLRSRRVRPLFTLDRSGHLVLAQGQ